MPDNEPLSLAESEATAALLVELGYQARAYGSRNGWGYNVIVTGTNGKSGKFRYVIRHAGQLPQAIEDLAAGLTGGDKRLEEGA